jgi:hypothetical protein
MVCSNVGVHLYAGPPLERLRQLLPELVTGLVPLGGQAIRSRVGGSMLIIYLSFRYKAEDRTDSLILTFGYLVWSIIFWNTGTQSFKSFSCV